jgi:peptidoglycan/LPS O-acetylase OafA/YrhL
VGRLLNYTALVTIGVLSYSLYLWQKLFLTPLNHTWTGLFPVNILVCFVVAWASYRFIEQPFLQLRRRRSGLKPLTSGPSGAVAYQVICQC